MPTLPMRAFVPTQYKLGAHERRAQTPACITKVFNFRLTSPDALLPITLVVKSERAVFFVVFFALFLF